MILGIAEPTFIVILLVGAMVSATLNSMRPKKSIPLLEIYLKKGGAIVWFVDANDMWWPYTLKKTRLGYFPMYTDRVKGIFHLNAKKKFYIGGANIPNFVFSINDMNNYNPVDMGIVNKFLDKNKIYKLERKHIRQAEKLRNFIGRYKNKPEAMQALESLSVAEVDEMKDGVNAAEKSTDEFIENYNDVNKTEYTFDERQRMLFLVDYMLKRDLIDDKIAETFIFKIENGMIDLNGLREALVDIPQLELSENMDVGIQRIVEEFGSENPLELTGVIDDARSNRKELKKMTPIPVKQFIPGGVILAAGIVVIMVLVLVSQGSISADMFGGLKLPGLP